MPMKPVFSIPYLCASLVIRVPDPNSIANINTLSTPLEYGSPIAYTLTTV